MVTAMPGNDPTDDFIDAAANSLGLPLDPAWKPAIRENLEVAFRLARLVEDFPLSDEAEPAPVYKA
jgi:1-carboxybiuret hydrolase subunit AtzG-like protein